MCGECNWTENKTEKSKAYFKGKYFESVEEMVEYSKKWPDEPFDVNEYKKFMEDRINEAAINSAYQRTNREMYSLLRMNTDWVQKEFHQGKIPKYKFNMIRKAMENHPSPKKVVFVGERPE